MEVLPPPLKVSHKLFEGKHVPDVKKATATSSTVPETVFTSTNNHADLVQFLSSDLIQIKKKNAKSWLQKILNLLLENLDLRSYSFLCFQCLNTLHLILLLMMIYLILRHLSDYADFDRFYDIKGEKICNDLVDEIFDVLFYCFRKNCFRNMFEFRGSFII